MTVRLLVVNADDFGLSDGVNAGVIEAHASGIVTSASLMVDRPGTEKAAVLARQHRDLSVGLHFVEPPDRDLEAPGQAAAELARQLERFRGLIGSDPTHLDSHHHAHVQSAQSTAAFAEAAGELGVPLRHDGQVAYIGEFWAQPERGVTDLRYVRRPHLLGLVEHRVADGWTELACHPARVTGDFKSSYLAEREVELETLTHPGLRDEIEATGVQLVSYRGWPG